MSLEYYISGGVLIVLGLLQMWVRRQGWAGDARQGQRAAFLGPVAVVVGLVLLAAGFFGR